MTEIITTEKRFEIDTDGFKIQMSEMPLWRLIQEVVSNSFDESSVTDIQLTVEEHGDDMVYVRCVDNGNGFNDHRDVFTLYKDSYKRTNPEQRGRYNLGDKQFLAVAIEGTVCTGKYVISFYEDVRTIEKSDESIKGVTITALFKRPDNESLESIIEKLHELIVPIEKRLCINNLHVFHKTVVKKFKCVLPTTIASGKNSKLVQVKRETEVVLYKKTFQEPARIYELGVHIQELQDDFDFHIDIRQKVPQVASRDVVSDKYLQTLYSEIAKNTLDLIDVNNVGSSWVGDALKKSDENTSKEILKKMYGTDKVMIESTTDHRANEKALESGCILIKGSTLDKDVRNNLIKNVEVIKYAGEEFETTFGDSEFVEPNEDMKRFARIVEMIAKDVVGRKITCSFFKMPDGADVANYGHNVISWNVSHLGKKFFKDFSSRATGILAHELAHALTSSECGQYSHLKMEFINNLEIVAGRIGFAGVEHWLKLVELQERINIASIDSVKSHARMLSQN